MDEIDKIYKVVADMTLQRVEKEKATKLSKTTLKMIALTERLHSHCRCF